MTTTRAAGSAGRTRRRARRSRSRHERSRHPRVVDATGHVPSVEIHALGFGPLADRTAPRLRARAGDRAGVLLARVPRQLRGARFRSEPGIRRWRRTPRRAGLLHEPRQRDGTGRRRRRRRRLRRLQPGGRRPARRARVAAHGRGDDLRGARPTARSPSCDGSSATLQRASTAPSSCCTDATEPLRPEGRPLYAGVAFARCPRRAARRGVASRRPTPRVPRRLAHDGVGRGRVRRDRDRAAHRALLGAPDAQLQRARGRGARPSSTRPRSGCGPAA